MANKNRNLNVKMEDALAGVEAPVKKVVASAKKDLPTKKATPIKKETKKTELSTEEELIQYLKSKKEPKTYNIPMYLSKALEFMKLLEGTIPTHEITALLEKNIPEQYKKMGLDAVRKTDKR